MDEKQAIVWFYSYWGRRSKRAVVIGETPKRYRVRFLDGLVGRWPAGTVRLVPKHAVEFAGSGLTPVAGDVSTRA